MPVLNEEAASSAVHPETGGCSPSPEGTGNIYVLDYRDPTRA